MAANDLDTGAFFLDKKVNIDFCDPATFHDRVLVVEGKKFHVTANHLSMFSEYFYGLFNSNFQEKDQQEIELKDVGAGEFETFLKMLYPLDVQVSYSNLRCLIRLSNMFLTPIVFQKCIKFLENPFNLHYITQTELLEWSTLSGSELLKRNVENRCIEMFNEAELSRYLKISADYKLDGLMISIVDKICKAHVGKMALDKSIVAIVLNSDFVKFEEYSMSDRLRSNQDDKISIMFTFIMLLKYDLPNFEEWFIYNFERLMVRPLSVGNASFLVEKLKNISLVHKVKLEKILLNAAKVMKENKGKWNSEDGMRNLLPELAFLLYKHDSKTIAAKFNILVEEFPWNIQISFIKGRIDLKMVKFFNRSKAFSNIEMVLHNNFHDTKEAMEHFIKSSSTKKLLKNFELMRLVKSSEEVAIFVRHSLLHHRERKVLIKHFFG